MHESAFKKAQPQMSYQPNSKTTTAKQGKTAGPSWGLQLPMLCSGMDLGKLHNSHFHNFVLKTMISPLDS